MFYTYMECTKNGYCSFFHGSTFISLNFFETCRTLLIVWTPMRGLSHKILGSYDSLYKNLTKIRAVVPFLTPSWYTSTCILLVIIN